MSRKAELRARVEARRKELEAKIARAKADAIGASNEAIDEAKAKLAELEKLVVDGWEKLSEKAAGKLNEWLK